MMKQITEWPQLMPMDKLTTATAGPKVRYREQNPHKDRVRCNPENKAMQLS